MNTAVPPFWAMMPVLRTIILAAGQRGAPVPELCRAGGFDPDLLEQGDVMVDLDQCCRVMEAALRLTGDPFLGLHIGEVSTPSMVGVLGHLMESSPDIRTACRHLENFYHSVTNLTTYHTEVSGELLLHFIEPIALWNELSPVSACMNVSLGMAATVHSMKLLSGRNLFPVQASLRYPHPGDTREYTRVLHTEPAFDQPANFIAFRLKDMQLPVLGFNRELNRIYQELLEKAIAKTRQQLSFSNEIKRMFLQNFSTALPQIGEIAQMLHISPRTLQRKLHDEGTSFQDIAESVKSEMAIDLLKKPGLTVAEIAYKLGYAEPSVFRRAFKKWTGKSPKGYSAQQAIG